MTYTTKDGVKVDAVRLQASEPTEPVTFDHEPEWLVQAIESGKLSTISGDRIDGSDWTYVFVETGSGEALVKPDDYIVLLEDGKLGTVSSSVWSGLFEETK